MTENASSSGPPRVAFRLIYDAGKAARERGEAHTANPHHVSTWEWEAWLKGWAGQADRRITAHLNQ